MKEKIKKILKLFIPPILLNQTRNKSKYGWFGNYETWEKAKLDSKGYDSPEILEKVKNSLLKVKNGEAVYERDSVIFDKIQYSWPLLTSLLWVASQNDNHLNLIDFGGSLGSSYYQNIGFLKHLKELRWNVVEQKNFVDCGKKYFEDNKLKFYENIENCLKETKPTVILILGTIQYVEKPYNLLKEIIEHEFEYIIFDRTNFLVNSDRITIQKIPPAIYDASYPAWFLNETKFLNVIKEKYDLITDFNALGGTRDLGDIESHEKGYIFKRK